MPDFIPEIPYSSRINVFLFQCIHAIENQTEVANKYVLLEKG